jgi:hypothetical protein
LTWGRLRQKRVQTCSDGGGSHSFWKERRGGCCWCSSTSDRPRGSRHRARSGRHAPSGRHLGAGLRRHRGRGCRRRPFARAAALAETSRHLRSLAAESSDSTAAAAVASTAAGRRSAPCSGAGSTCCPLASSGGILLQETPAKRGSQRQLLIEDIFTTAKNTWCEKQRC